MKRVTVEVLECECLRCGWKWRAEGLERPERCGRCKDPRWDRERSGKAGNKEVVAGEKPGRVITKRDHGPKTRAGRVEDERASLIDVEVF